MAFDGLPKKCPIASPLFFCFLGRQLEVAPFETCVATSSQLIAYQVAHHFSFTTWLCIQSTINVTLSLRVQRLDPLSFNDFAYQINLNSFDKISHKKNL